MSEDFPSNRNENPEYLQLKHAIQGLIGINNEYSKNYLGDELQEFLDAFGLEPMELPERVYEKKMKHLEYLLRDERRKRDKDDRCPYPYVFKPPFPPDDLSLAPRTQLRQPPKKKDTEEKIHCQYCGIKLTKEEHFTHSCKNKPKNK